MRLALLPLGLATLVGAGASVYLSRVDAAGPAWTTPVVFGSAAALLVLVGILAVSSATKTEADFRRRINSVRRSTVETHYKVWQVLDDLQRATPPDQRWSVPLPNPGSSARNVDETIALLAAEARHLRAAAEAIAARGIAAPAAPPKPMAPVPLEAPAPAPIAAAAQSARTDDGEPGVGIFVNRARRLQVLAHREIVELDFLERQVEDPDLLKGLFSVDHLATRVRRHAENLAVLGGGPSHRQWSRPVNVYEALRSSVAEVEHYARVKLVRPVDGTLKGHAVADFIHLVAELIENATLFSPPSTQVLIRVAQVRTGMAVEVEDRGLGMAQEDREFYNGVLSTPAEVDLEALLADGRIGLYVVSQLARRHKFVVQLQSNIFGGTQAVVVVPEEVLGGGRSVNEPKESAPKPRKPAAETGPQLPSVQLTSTGQHARPQPVAGRGAHPPRQAVAAIEPVRTVEPPRSESDDRPALPKRARQTHLAPQLRDASQQGGTGSEAGHDPGLMKAFQQGQHRAQDDPIPNPDSSTPYQDEEA
ncbi:sensor histidine kinase [Glycomyces paridis]|nr:ATP-binding protein [Glycomyces paridis]